MSISRMWPATALAAALAFAPGAVSGESAEGGKVVHLTVWQLPRPEDTGIGAKCFRAMLALRAFMAAYGNFMFAVILCPDERMRTLMVFLYQLQINGHMGLTFAAPLIAALPTFIVFVFCQNIIIRGTVVPVEK